MIDQIESLVGAEVGVSDWFEMTQDRVAQFADATNDHQWIHVDQARAADGPFGATIAHGFLTLSMIVDLAPMPSVEGVAMAINYGLDRVRFISPVLVGSRIRARTKILEVSPIDGGVHMKSEVTIEIENSDRPACVAETLTRYYG